MNYWGKAMKSSRDPPDEIILKLVLGWPPFTSFLQVLSKLVLYDDATNTFMFITYKISTTEP